MHLFYTPDIIPPLHVLGEDESKHCTRVLRLAAGDEIFLTDGRGTMYRARLKGCGGKNCTAEVTETLPEWGRRGYGLTMAVAPTKNAERYEWFLEKATEVGCDIFIPLLTSHGERRTVRTDRGMKIITGAVKQSLKAYHPQLLDMTPFAEVISRHTEGRRLIAHCGQPVGEIKLLKHSLEKGEDAMILIGPEGDFSPEEINFAVVNGFTEVSLGESRLRTETAAIAAVVTVAVINQ